MCAKNLGMCYKKNRERLSNRARRSKLSFFCWAREKTMVIAS